MCGCACTRAHRVPNVDIGIVGHVRDGRVHVDDVGRLLAGMKVGVQALDEGGLARARHACACTCGCVREICLCTGAPVHVCVREWALPARRGVARRAGA